MIQMTAFETIIGMALHEQEDNWLAAQLMTVHRNAMKNKAKKEETVTPQQLMRAAQHFAY